jgi:three-Cys-motif partner protein
MPGTKNNTTVPDTYQGREQAYIKHQLLEGYLEKLFLIVGMSSGKLGITELCYVDCFAGPWLDNSEDLGSTSIAISLRILNKCQQELQHHGKTIRFRALYVEKDRTVFERLKRYLQEHTPTGIEAQALEGDFIELRSSILDWCSERPFVFFFIDPTQWTPVGVEILKSLLQRPRSEFLINFMYDFLSRAASMSDLKVQMVDLLGEAPEVKDMHGAAREKYLLDMYRRNLKLLLPGKWPARSAYVRVLDRKKERPKYHLVYLTSHPRGIVEFMEISETLDQIQKRVRAATKRSDRIKKTGQNELFSSDEFLHANEGKVSMEEVEGYWLACLSPRPKKVGLDEFADMLEETDWFPSDLQRALGNLIAAGKVQNLDARGKRRKNFLHFDKDGERLQIMEENK